MPWSIGSFAAMPTAQLDWKWNTFVSKCTFGFDVLADSDHGAEGTGFSEHAKLLGCGATLSLCSDRHAPRKPTNIDAQRILAIMDLEGSGFILGAVSGAVCISQEARG